MEFYYTAIDKDGNKITGTCQARSKREVSKKLTRAKLHLIHCKFKFVSLIKLIQRKPLSNTFLIEFSRQMSILLGSGLSLSQAFELVSVEQSRPANKLCVAELMGLVQQGQSLSSAMKQVSTSFNNNYCEVIAVGEQTGALAQAFEQNYAYLSAQAKLAQQLKQACLYPILVVLVSIIVISILLIKVIPGFESLFSSFDQPLPYLTTQVISVAKFVQEKGVTILLFLVFISLVFWFCIQWRKVRYWVDKIKLRLPVFATLYRLNFYTAFALNCHNLLAAGIPLHQVLAKLKYSFNNLYLAKKLEYLEQEINTGKSLNQSCAQTQIFPSLFIQLIKVGEESGTLDARLKNLAELYHDRLDNRVKNMVNLIEPVLMIFIGGLIGTLVLVMYLPIFEMSTFL